MAGIQSTKAWVLALAVAVGASAWFSSSAGAALIGPPDLTSNWSGSFGCGVDKVPCEYVNLSLPSVPASGPGSFDVQAGKVRSPVTGTITKWRVNIEEFSGTGAGPLQLQVLRRTVDEPGRTADKFRAVRESSEENSSINLNTFFTSLRIRKGDFIGLNIIGASTAVREIDAGVVGFLNTPLTPGGSAAVFDDVTAERQALFNATVKN